MNTTYSNKWSRKFLAGILLLCYLVPSAQVKWKEDSAYINGKVLRSKDPDQPAIIQLVVYDPVKGQKKYSTELDSGNNFVFVFPLWYPQEIYINYRNSSSLLCIPGEQLRIEIDTTNVITIKNKKSKKNNEDIAAFLKKIELPDDTAIHSDSLFRESPAKHKEVILNRVIRRTALLEQFNTTNNTSPLFREWAQEHIRYDAWSDLLLYPSKHAAFQKINENEIALPLDYYHFINEYNLDNNEIVAVAQVRFLNAYYRYVMSHPADSFQKANAFFEKGEISKGAAVLLNGILNNTSGFAQQLFLSKFYLDAIEGQQIKEFEAVYDRAYMTDLFFRNIVEEAHLQLKNYLSNQFITGAKIDSAANSPSDKTFREIIMKYKGKVIYIDFWAPWCTPCMEEMPFSKKIQEQFSNKNVVFLFIANRCSDDSWKATIANNKLTGEHIKLTDDQYNAVAAQLNISGIPHYVLIDKNGLVVSGNAPRPSQQAMLAEQLDRLIH